MSLRGAKQCGNFSLRQINKLKVALIIIGYLLFNALFIASDNWVAIYKFFKIIEFSLLGFVIYKIKPKLETVSLVLSVAVFYSSVLAIWQFFAQKSIDGIFWFLGERTFNSATPAIAATSIGGNLLLRPYATFPHPNVLGGFLAVVLPLIFFSLCRPLHSKLFKVFLFISLILGITALILSFSKVAWIVAALGFILSKKKIKLQRKIIVPILFLLILLSIFIPLITPDTFWAKYQYWQERVQLIKLAIPMTLQNIAFGVGLNNSIIQLQSFSLSFPGLFIFQPVHNIFLLILTETGLTGLAFFMWGFLQTLTKAFKTNAIFIAVLAQFFFLGLFDHYLLTLQQGQLMLVIFTALIFASKVAY